MNETLMQDEMISREFDKLAVALSKAQACILGASKDKKNPHFKSSYADLSSVWDACRSALTENGFAVSQTTEIIGPGQSVLVTRLLHSSGQWIKSTMPLITAKNDMQALGSAVTYARRFSLAAIVGVCPEDDDGNKACEPAPVKPDPLPPRRPLNKSELCEIEKLICQDLRPDELRDILTEKYGEFEGLTSDKFDVICRVITKRLSKQKEMKIQQITATA